MVSAVGKIIDTLVTIQVPTDEPIWSWLFDSRYSNLDDNGKYTGLRDAESNRYLGYLEMRELSLHLSTSLAEEFEIESGDCISIFCKNSVWYPVAMFAGFRLGQFILILCILAER
jgi:acyl-coenzyme A synthetase/AMP-(fatty) acid ligase